VSHRQTTPIVGAEREWVCVAVALCAVLWVVSAQWPWRAWMRESAHVNDSLSLSYGKQRRLFSKHSFYRLPHGEPYPGDLTVDPHAAASPPAATGCDSWYSEPSNPSIFFLTQPYPKSDPRHGVGPAARHEADGVVRLGGARRARRAAVYTGGGTPSFDDDYLSVEPVFDTDADDLHDGPVFGTYLANLDDAPVFDADPADLADGPVFDVDPADLADGPVFDADPGDLDDGPVFDTEPLPDRVAAPMCELAKSEFNAFDQGLDDLSSARVNASLDEGLLLAEKHTQVEAASSFGTWVIFSSNEAVPATTVATPSMCSPKCLHRAVHAEKTLVIKPLQEFERIKDDRALVSICRVLDDFELLIHGISTPFFIEHRSVLSDSVEPQGCASKYWDPALVVSDIVVDDGFAHRLWGPGSPGEWQFIEFIRSGADYGSTSVQVSHPVVNAAEVWWLPYALDCGVCMVLYYSNGVCTVELAVSFS
jgi:hypothetical protein